MNPIGIYLVPVSVNCWQKQSSFRVLILSVDPTIYLQLDECMKTLCLGGGKNESGCCLAKSGSELHWWRSLPRPLLQYRSGTIIITISSIITITAIL